MTLKMIHDRILVERHDAMTETESGIILTKEEKACSGKIVQCGTCVVVNGHLQEPRCAVGDVVHFGKHAGTDMEIDGKQYVIMREEDVLGVERE